jgi:hypothetical protein
MVAAWVRLERIPILLPLQRDRYMAGTSLLLLLQCATTCCSWLPVLLGGRTRGDYWF